jgi:putative RecB family exonuclease
MEPQPSELPLRSYSQLSQLEECGERYRLQRIERKPRSPAVWFPAGNAFHEVTELFDRAALTYGLDHPNVLGTDWLSLFPETFDRLIAEQVEKTPDVPVGEWRTAGKRTKANPNGEDIDWWMGYGPDLVDAYINWRAKAKDRYAIWVAADGTPGIEWEGEAALGGVRVTARADRIFTDLGTGATIIVDLKTGRYEPDDPLQLRIYRMVIERVTAEPMWYGAFYMAREARLSAPVVLDTTNEWAIEERFARSERAIELGLFIPRPSPRNCTQCDMRPHCQFVED